MSATHTPGPWMIATSNSWRRIVSRDGQQVCEPITQNDGHPDLHFKNGGEDGPDARLLAAAPMLLGENAALRAVARLVIHHGAVLDCPCSLAERGSGHRVGCHVPGLRDALDTLEALERSLACAESTDRDGQR